MEDMEETCAVHDKELDMVCLEINCETPVCSKCILIGEHKNHKYVEKEKFFKTLETEKRKINSLFTEINNSEQKLKKTNNSLVIKNLMTERKKILQEELTSQCERLMRVLEKKRNEISKEINIYFDQQEEKLQNYVKECVDSTNTNKEYKNKIDENLKNLANSGEDIESGFLFKKKCEQFKFEENSHQILSNIQELQKLINIKKEQCITSFFIEYQDIDPNLIQIKKEEISFKQDLRERMKIFTKNENEEENKKEMEFEGGLNQALNDYSKRGEKESDLFNENIEKYGNDNFNEFNMNPPPNQFMKQSMTKPNMLSNQSQFNLNKPNNLMTGNRFMTPQDSAFYSQTNNAVHPDIHSSIKRNSQSSNMAFNNNVSPNICKLIC